VILDCKGLLVLQALRDCREIRVFKEQQVQRVPRVRRVILALRGFQESQDRVLLPWMTCKASPATWVLQW
jgi:hypothetical protein